MFIFNSAIQIKTNRGTSRKEIKIVKTWKVFNIASLLSRILTSARLLQSSKNLTPTQIFGGKKSFQQQLSFCCSASNTKMETPKVQILPTPVKSSNDKKDYKCIRLSNGLTALLVSDTSYDLEKLDEEEAQLEGKKEISISRKF